MQSEREPLKLKNKMILEEKKLGSTRAGEARPKMK